MRLRFESRTLTAENIIGDLPSGCPFTSAPPAGRYIWPLSILFTYRFGTRAYTCSAENDGRLLYVSTVAEWAAQNQGFWMHTGNNVGCLTDFLFATTFAGASHDDVSLAGVEGQPLALFTQDAGTSYAAGDGTLEVTTVYLVKSR